MLIVLDVFVLNPAARERKNPSANPSVWSNATEPRSVGPAARICVDVRPMMEEQIAATVITATAGAKGSTYVSLKSRAKCFNATPAMIGNSTTLHVLKNKPTPSTPITVPANCLVSVGVITVAMSVLTVVNTTLKGTLAPAKYVTTLDAVPPGQHPTKINPAASDAASPKNVRAIKNASVGITVYCNATPMPIFHGAAKILTKSAFSNVMPIPSIVDASAYVTASPLNQLTVLGLVIPSTAPANTSKGKYAVTSAHARIARSRIVNDSPSLTKNEVS
mmetsp:Transcript_6501/g.21913  ORF Transcript_6501/g.21913 Transcript_6501/m.21913 type:complete len:277 (+) Transcript_6501:412-1242(+)